MAHCKFFRPVGVIGKVLRRLFYENILIRLQLPLFRLEKPLLRTIHVQFALGSCSL